MKRQYLRFYVRAAPLLMVGALAVGVPVWSPLVLAGVLARPLMMIFTMTGMRGGAGARTAAMHPGAPRGTATHGAAGRKHGRRSPRLSAEQKRGPT
ncbi:hypothetical protein [Pseudonocardia sp. T1-2H]|uniref:hypothetical protein n=1 Tax=Pseudonocardia sp. T1-2H TaxID=3128899 RepID=UPI003101A875